MDMSGNDTGDYRKEIIVELKKHLPRLAKLAKTSKKKDIIKSIIVEALRLFPERVRLPSIRAMAETLGVTIVSIQKSVSSLANEGLLITKSRSSVISVVRSQEQLTSENQSSSFPSFSTEIKFRTDSGDDYQRKMWFKIRDRFNFEHPATNVQIQFGSYSICTAEGSDAMECSGYGWQDQMGVAEPLPVKGFLANYDKFFRQNIEDTIYGETHIPICYRTCYLFYNPSLLTKKNIPLPGFCDFTGQFAYLDNYRKESKSLGLESKIFSINHPVLFAGDLLSLFINYVKNGGSDLKTRQVLIDGFSKILQYLNLCNFDYAGTHAGGKYVYNDFLTETSPFFIGTSSTYWEFINKPLKPDWQVYPLFTVDNKFTKVPIVGMVAADTKVPVESAKFIEFLLRRDIQSDFIAPSGMIGVKPKREEINKILQNKTGEKFIDIFANSTPLFFEHKNDFYLVNSILNSEFWTAHFRKNIDAGNLLARSLFLGEAIENLNSTLSRI